MNKTENEERSELLRRGAAAMELMALEQLCIVINYIEASAKTDLSSFFSDTLDHTKNN
jgi:hypothetical protein